MKIKMKLKGMDMVLVVIGGMVFMAWLMMQTDVNN
jgi:hypothetical protein